MKDIKKPFLKSIISLALVVALVVGAVPLPKFDMKVHAATQTVTKTAKWDMDGGKSGTTTKTDEYTLYTTPGGSLRWTCAHPNVNYIYLRYNPQYDETGRTSLRGDVLKYGGIVEFPNIAGKVTKVEISNILFNYAGADTNVVANMYAGIDRNSTSSLLHIAGSTDDYDFPSTNDYNIRSVTFEGDVNVDSDNPLKLIFYGEAQQNELYPVEVMFVDGSITVTYEVEEEIIGDPGHSFSYTTNGNTLTATCNQTDSKHNCDLTERKATLTLTANDSSYDGSLLKRYATLNTQDFVDATGITGITSTFSYVNKSTNEVTTDGVVQPGEYTVTATITINETNYTLTKDFSINANSHSITNNYSQFTLNKITANPGDEITISIDQSIILTSLSVVGTTANLTLDNNEIRYSDQNGVYFFRMPDEDVTISATWQKLLTNSDITVAAIADQTYTGSAIEPAVIVLDGETDITDQCDITFSNNTNIGKATVTITAKTTSASYSGSTTKTFSIVYPTVSFAPGEGGGGNMDAVSLNGTEYTLPTCTFTAPENKTFKEWSVKIGDAAPVSKQPNDTIEVTANTTVTAVWKDIHTHNFTYTAEAAVITATCDNTDGNCPLTDHKATLTIAAPLHMIYGDGKEAVAEITDVNSIKGEAKVQYQQKNGSSYGTATESAPTDAGDYRASITLGNATASVEYNIAKADSIADPPTASATYGQTLSDVSLTNPTGNTAGDWAWVNDGTTSVGSVGNNTFKANFTPSNTNYSDKNNVDVVVTVSKAAAQTITDVTQNLLYTETSVSASVAGKMPENAGTLTYTAGAANTTGSVTVSNFTVDNSGNVTATISGGVSGDTVTLPVTISSTNYADSSVNVNIKLIAKNTQTIMASDVTATYGDTGKSISANVTEPATGGGTLSYAVKSGSDDYIGVDDNGKLTIKAVPPTDGKAYVTVTAAETADYAAATKDVTVTIGKATLTVAAKDQSIYVGDNVPSLSEPVLNKHYTVTGLVGEDVLTTAPTLEYKKEGSTVTPNNTTAGTYDIVPSGASAGNNYNVSYQNGSLTISEKDSAAVTKVPKAKNLTYNGSAQELVTAGEADGGEMYYALGTEMEATETYSTSIPTGTEAKTYYVWYKAIGDGSHSDTEPKAIAVTIGEEIIIRYDSNGGSGSMKDQKIEKGVEIELKTNTFTRENYSFKEWNTKSDGSGDSYKDKAKVTLNDGMTLYAQWTKVEVHNHTFEKVDAVEPGCETEGHKAYYRCTGCDKWFADAAGSVEITDKNSVIRKATGHRWDSGEVTKEATYTETGIRTYTCKNDGNHTKDEVIPVKQRDYSSDDRDSDSDDSDSGSSSSGVKRGIDVNSSSEATGNSSSGTDTSTNSGLSSGTTGMTAGSTGGPVTDTTNSTGTAGTNGNVGTVNGGLIGSTAAEGNGGLYDSGHQAVQVKEILSLSNMLAAVLNKDAAYSGSGVNAGYQVDALLIDDGMPLSDVGGTWSSGSEHWHYTKSDGTEARDEWLNLSYNGVNCWYLFDEHGDMATGWVDYKGERYYLVPETDGWKGRMAEGWVRVDDKWYYFESTAGSTQGRLLRNGFTPDGHFVGDDGALVQ